MINSLIKIMKLILPITPHLANEILDILKCTTKNKWPSIKKDLISEIKFAVQINGKTRDILNVTKDISQKELEETIKKNSKVTKFFGNKKIIRTIFVKNKIINYILK